MEFAAADGEELPLSVGELIGLLQITLEENYSSVLVAGELTSFSKPMSGHCYFTLSDADAAIDGVMWRGDARRLSFKPETGDQVVCRGRIGVYPKQGRMQLYAVAMKPLGEGAAQKAFERLKRRLAGEGLFDECRKRRLPFLPRTVGIVTSRSGAALHDILTTLARRFPPLRVVLAPATVQGDGAADEIVAALADLAAWGGADVVIVGRGGGAAEDLAAFNEEKVVRAVAAFPVPVVSAVGHEVDVSLCDLAADHRAATPTAAAEAVVPLYVELDEQLSQLEQRLLAAARRGIDYRRQRVAAVRGRLRDPALSVAALRQSVDTMGRRLERSLSQRHRGAQMRLAAAESKLHALNPSAVLDRGYALVRRFDRSGRGLGDGGEGSLVRSAGEIERGEELQLRFSRGGADVRVLEVHDD